MTTDNMSNEEVIEVLKGIVFSGFDRTTSKERQALDLAIKALEEKSKDCSDCKRYDFPYFVIKFDKEQMQELVDKAKAEVLASIERPQSDIRWTDKLSVKSNGDIIDFEGRVVGHIDLEVMKGGAE